MGVVYKLQQDIVDFIIQEKKVNSRISCRKLVDIIKEKFNKDVSKSSINNIIKKEKLSSPVGRTPKKPSKDNLFKIPSDKKNLLRQEARRYIDSSLLAPKSDEAKISSVQSEIKNISESKESTAPVEDTFTSIKLDLSADENILSEEAISHAIDDALAIDSSEDTLIKAESGDGNTSEQIIEKEIFQPEVDNDLVVDQNIEEELTPLEESNKKFNEQSSKEAQISIPKENSSGLQWVILEESIENAESEYQSEEVDLDESLSEEVNQEIAEEDMSDQETGEVLAESEEGLQEEIQEDASQYPQENKLDENIESPSEENLTISNEEFPSMQVIDNFEEENEEDQIEMETEEVSLREDPVKDLLEKEEFKEHPMIVEEDADDPSREKQLVDEGLSYDQLGFMIFKAAQWDVSRQSPFQSTLIQSISSLTNEQAHGLSEWLTTAALFRIDDLHDFQSGVSETETVINQYSSEVDIVDLVSQFGKYNDAFSFGLSLNTEANMMFTQVDSIHVVLKNGQTLFFDPLLTGFHTEQEQVRHNTASLSRVMNDVPDRLINNIEPLVLTRKAPFAFDREDVQLFFKFMNNKEDFEPDKILVQDSRGETVGDFQSLVNQPRKFIFNIEDSESQNRLIAAASGEKEEYSCPLFGRSFSYEKALIDLDSTILVLVWFNHPVTQKQIVLLSNIIEDVKGVINQWIMRFYGTEELSHGDIEVTRYSIMDATKTILSPFEQVKDITQAIFSVMKQRFFPENRQNMEFTEFCEIFGKTSGKIYENSDNLLIKLELMGNKDQNQNIVNIIIKINSFNIFDYKNRRITFIY